VAKTFRRYVISVAAPGAAPKVTEQLTMLGAKAAHSPASAKPAAHTSASAQPAARMAKAVIPTGLGSGCEVVTVVQEQLVGGPNSKTAKTLSTHNADKSVSAGAHELHTGSSAVDTVKTASLTRVQHKSIRHELAGEPAHIVNSHVGVKWVHPEALGNKIKMMQLAGIPASEREMTSMQMLPLLRPLQPLAPFPGND
jgi:hypothetical protein